MLAEAHLPEAHAAAVAVHAAVVVTSIVLSLALREEKRNGADPGWMLSALNAGLLLAAAISYAVAADTGDGRISNWVAIIVISLWVWLALAPLRTAVSKYLSTHGSDDEEEM